MSRQTSKARLTKEYKELVKAALLQRKQPSSSPSSPSNEEDDEYVMGPPRASPSPDDFVDIILYPEVGFELICI